MELDPALSQSLATLIGAIATAITIIVGYYFGPNAPRRVRNRRERDEQVDFDI